MDTTSVASDAWDKALVNAFNVEVRHAVLSLHPGPKNFIPKKMPTPNPKLYKFKTPSPTYTTQKCKN